MKFLISAANGVLGGAFNLSHSTGLLVHLEGLPGGILRDIGVGLDGLEGQSLPQGHSERVEGAGGAELAEILLRSFRRAVRL